jgi:predicted O-methyltransferase YrrM
MAKVIEERESEFNGRIQVIKDMNGMRLVAGELDQSGGAVVNVLKGAVSVASNIKRALVLGMGGGTVVKLIQGRFPEVELTCVEIDPVMVELAGKYFGNTENENLRIITGDAAVWVEQRAKSKEGRGGHLRPHPGPLLDRRGKVGPELGGGFDYILVDCYLGNQVPEQCEAEEFLRGVKALLTRDGVAVFNRLFFDAEMRRKAQEFIFKLEPVFPKIDLRRVGSNLLICCQRMKTD